MGVLGKCTAHSLAPTQVSCGKRELVCRLWGLFLFWCLSLVTLVQAFIVSRVPLDKAGSGLGWDETSVENVVGGYDEAPFRVRPGRDGTSRRTGWGIMMRSEKCGVHRALWTCVTFRVFRWQRARSRSVM